MSKPKRVELLRSFCVDIIYAHQAGHLSTLNEECKEVAQELYRRLESEYDEYIERTKKGRKEAKKKKKAGKGRESNGKGGS